MNMNIGQKNKSFKIMKQKHIYIKFILPLFFIALSCEDMLDLKPQSNLTNETIWNVADDFEKAANAFYGYLPQFFDITQRDKYTEILTGNDRDEISNSSYGVPVSSEFYTERYEEIRNINYLFENAEGYNGSKSINKYIGEAYFFRAYCHYRLFKDFGPVIYVNKVLDVNNAELYSARDSRDDFIDKLITDLDSAINILPHISSQSNADIGRITKGAAQALLAQIALFEGTWQKYHYNNTERSNELLSIAIENSEEIIEKEDYELFYNTRLGDLSYRYLFILENVTSNPAGVDKQANNEYIFRNRYNNEIRWINQNVNHTLNSGHYSPTLKMVDMYLCDDGLPIDISDHFDKESAYETFSGVYDNRDPRMTQSLRVPAQLHWNHNDSRVSWKDDEEDIESAYIANPSIPSRTATGFLNKKFVSERETPVNQEAFDLPLIRLAEVYLIYAEAKYELNGNITDEDLDLTINKLRERVGMPFLTNDLVASNGLNMLDEIRRERTVELYLEGKRYDDIRRWKIAEDVMSQNMLGANMNGDYGSRFAKLEVGDESVYYEGVDTEGKLDENGFYLIEDAISRQFMQRHYLQPLPFDQLNLNENLTQNEGWN
jgi:hypothetical protein